MPRQAEEDIRTKFEYDSYCSVDGPTGAAPAAGTVVCSLDFKQAITDDTTFLVEVHWGISGGAGTAADVGNMGLYKGRPKLGTTVSQPTLSQPDLIARLPSNTLGADGGPVTLRLTMSPHEVLTVQAIGAGSAGMVYAAVILARRIPGEPGSRA